MRHFLVFIISILIISGCKENQVINHDLINRIPTDSKIVLHTDNLKDLDHFFSNNALCQEVSNLSRVKELKAAASFLKYYDLEDDSLIALSIQGKNEVVITLITSSIEQVVDSTSVTSLINYNNEEIVKTHKPDGDYFAINHKGMHLASSSQLVIESLIRRNVDDYVFDDGFKKIYQRTKSGTTFFVKATEKKWLEQFLLGKNINDNGNYAQWYQLEVQPNDVALQLNGVITYRDSVKMHHDLYNHIQSTENRIQEIVPVNLGSVKSVTYKNPSQLIENLKRFHNNDVKVGSQLKDILNNTQEMSEVYLKDSNALVFTLKPYEALFMNLDSLSSAKSTYRNQVIYELTNPVKTAAIQPLIVAREYKYVTVIEQHIIFSNSSTVLEEFISNFQNKTVLAEQSWWKKSSQALSSTSSLLEITGLKQFKDLALKSSKGDFKIIKKIDKDVYPLVISQYVHEDEYAHYHMLIPFVNRNDIEQQVSQIGTYKSSKKIVAGPFLFPNHLNKKYDVVFQDKDFTLHLLSDTGLKRWSKKLDGLILGNIEVTDAYKNGRKQMAFATSSSVYFLDRNGKDVNTYPKRFKDLITQPLSVFDYDGKRDYRFLVTQGDELLMMDRDGKTVTGFKYKRGATIKSQPRHIRVRKKDFIVFAKKDNSIALLNRRGGVRTVINKKVKLTSQIFLHKNKAIALTESGKLLELDPIKGTLKYTSDYSKDARLDATSSIKLIQDNNKLIINNKKISLPYGSYLAAHVEHLSSGDFIHVIETGEHRVYILNKNGEVLSSFPVYGESQSDVAQSKKRYLSTLDGDEVIIYEW
ncbi:hypothetical protein [uncultured Nonlabens sp.]|uniref:hypothetical protein n=1 Tax=uncultured Nonlabens sp. TaxID=859306 RepID=UPI0026033E26|nr:hypothetical protein [uncultured Nonlabens sp.]